MKGDAMDAATGAMESPACYAIASQGPAFKAFDAISPANATFLMP